MDLSLAVTSLMNNKDVPSEFDSIINQFISTLDFSSLELSAFAEDEENFSKFVQCLLLPPYRRPFFQNKSTRKSSPKRSLLYDNRLDINPDKKQHLNTNNAKNCNFLLNEDSCARQCITCLTNMATKNPDLKRIIAASTDFDIITSHMLANFFNRMQKRNKNDSRQSSSGSQSYNDEYKSKNTSYSSLSENSSKENKKSDGSNSNLVQVSSNFSTPNSKSALSDKYNSKSTFKSNEAVCSKSSPNFDILEEILPFMRFASAILSADNVKQMNTSTIHSIITSSITAIEIKCKELQDALLNEKYNPSPRKNISENSNDEDDKNTSLIECTTPSCVAWAITTITSLSRNVSGASSIIVARPEYPSLRVKLALLLGSNNSSEVVGSISALVTLFPNTLSYSYYHLKEESSPSRSPNRNSRDNQSNQISPRTAVEIALMALKCDTFENEFPIAYKLASWIISDISNFPKPAEIELELGFDDSPGKETNGSLILSTLSHNEINDLLSIAQKGRIRAFEIFGLLSESSEQLHDQTQIVLSSNRCVQLFNIIRSATSSEDSFVTVAACNFLNIIFPFGANSLNIEYESKPKLKSRINNNKNNERDLIYSSASKAFISCLNTLLVDCIHYKSKTPSLASVSTSNINNSTPVPNISNLLKREASASMLGFLCQIQGAATYAVSSLQRCESRLFLDFERQIEANNSFLSVSYYLFLYYASTFFVDWKQKLSHIVISTQFTALLSHVLTEAQNRIAITRALQALIIASNSEHFNVQHTESKIRLRSFNRNKMQLLVNQSNNGDEVNLYSSYYDNIGTFYIDSLVESPLFNSIVEGFLVTNSSKKAEKENILTELNEFKKKNELDFDEMKVEYELNNEELSKEVLNLQKQLIENKEISEATDALNNQKINNLEAEIRKLKAVKKKLEGTVNNLSESQQFNASRPSSRSSFHDISLSSRSDPSSPKPQKIKQRTQKKSPLRIPLPQNPNSNAQSTQKNAQSDTNKSTNENSENVDNIQRTPVNPFCFSTQLRLKEQEKLEYELKKCQGEITQLRETTLRESKASANLRGLLEKSKKENSQLRNKLAALEKKCSIQESQIFRMKSDNEELQKNIREKTESNSKMKKKISQIELQKQMEIGKLEKDNERIRLLASSQKSSNSPNAELVQKIEQLESQLKDYQMRFKLIHKTTGKETSLPSSIADFMKNPPEEE